MGPFHRQQFCLSAPQHALQKADEGLAIGQQQLMHLLHLPQQVCTQKGPVPVAALPCRFYTSSPGFLFPQRSEVPKQAFGFSPVFSLSQVCSSSSSRTSASHATPLAHEAVIALRPSTELVLASSSSALQRLQQQQQQQQQQEPGHQQQKPVQKLPSLPALQQSATDRPWLGRQLDVGGYSKRGFISGGGKEQNQDRGLILEEFRSPNELLLGVMDGHGTFGHLVSTYLAQHLPAVLMQKLVAAAAVLDNSSSNTGQKKQQQKRLKLLGRANKQQEAEQQQQGPDMQFAVPQVPYVVVPDHWPKYGFTPAPDTIYAASSATAPSKHGRSAGRAVSKQQLVEQPHSHPLDDCSSSSSSSSSSQGSSQQWLSPVSHESVQEVPLSRELLTGAFTMTDHLLSGSGVNVIDSGSTCLLCHIGPRSITTAWVGDSRAVLGRRKQLLQLPGMKQQQQQPRSSQDSSAQELPSLLQQEQPYKWVATPLSLDHKPERHDEYLRINLNEGRVAQIMGRGPYRVWFKGIDYPGLAMSRAFGDLPCRRIGVTVEPEVSVHPLRADDEVLVAATDGVWDVLSNEEVVALAGGASGAQAAARMLVEVAEARWLETEGGYIDDITAVVVRAQPAGAASSA